MPNEVLTLFHGTSAEIVGGAVLKGRQPLIGKRVLNDPGWSGSLTNDKEFAARWAHRKGGDPIVITYNLPFDILFDEGIIGMKSSARGYSTNIEIPVDKLPKAYLVALFGFNMLDEETLKMLVAKGQLNFHEIPFKYLSSFEDV